MKQPVTVLAALLAITLSSMATSATPAVEVKSVGVYLFLTPSGEFSEDIAALPGFSSWNYRSTVPVRPQDEAFKAYLIKVRLRSSAEKFFKGQIGSIEVRSVKTKKRLYFSKIANVYISPEGETVVARLVDGHVCEPAQVTATIGSSKQVKQLNFECGE